MKTNKVVPLRTPHTLIQGDGMEYAATYNLGPTVVHIDDYFVRNQSPEEQAERDELIGLLAYEIESRLEGETA